MYGYTIKARRLASGLSQAQMCRTLGIVQSTLCKYEGGRIVPEKIARVVDNWWADVRDREIAELERHIAWWRGL